MEPTSELGQQFLAHWDGSTLSAAQLEQNIAGLRAEDLWLATACAVADSAALAAFEADVMPLTSVALRSMRCDAATVDDISSASCRRA